MGRLLLSSRAVACGDTMPLAAEVAQKYFQTILVSVDFSQQNWYRLSQYVNPNHGGKAMLRHPNVQFPEGQDESVKRQIISIKERQLGGKSERFRIETGPGCRILKVSTAELATSSLTKAEQFAWGFPVGILGEGYPTALFEFRFDGSDSPGAWSGTIEGEFAKKLSTTFDTTASSFEPLVNSVRPFELCALWLSSIHIKAVWMKGEGDDRSGDYFWPLSSPSSSSVDQLGWFAHSYTEFMTVVQKYAMERLAQARPRKHGEDTVGG